MVAAVSIADITDSSRLPTRRQLEQSRLPEQQSRNSRYILDVSMSGQFKKLEGNELKLIPVQIDVAQAAPTGLP